MIITQKFHVHAEQRENKQCDKENTSEENQQNEPEKAKNNVRAEQRKNIANIENKHGESEENDVKRNIENLRMALHAIEGNQIEKETQINRILNVSV
jgi:hypothetical protein